MANQDGAPRKTGTDTVIVACKLPHGLIMRVHQMVEVDYPVLGGGMRRVKEARQLPDEYRINGNAHPQNAGPACEMVGGYALTTGIPRDFWERWLKENAESAMIKNDIIFAHVSIEGARSEANEKTGVRSNLERLNPNKLPPGVEIDKDATSRDTLKRLAQAA